MSTAVHEDGYELSLTVNFALRNNNDPLVGERAESRNDFLSSYTEGRKSSLTRYPSQESLGTELAVSSSKEKMFVEEDNEMVGKQRIFLLFSDSFLTTGLRKRPKPGKKTFVKVNISRLTS